MDYSIANELELNQQYQKLVSARTALVKEAKNQQEYESLLNALPNDKEAVERNIRIRKMIASKHIKTITDHDQLQVKRHRTLLDAYENMVRRESVLNEHH